MTRMGLETSGIHKPHVEKHCLNFENAAPTSATGKLK